VLSKRNDAPTRGVCTAGQSLLPWSSVQADVVQFDHLGYWGCCNIGRDRPAVEFAGVRLGDGGCRDAGAVQFDVVAGGRRVGRQGH
jgi:hypothetical protein